MTASSTASRMTKGLGVSGEVQEESGGSIAGVAVTSAGGGTFIAADTGLASIAPERGLSSVASRRGLASPGAARAPDAIRAASARNRTAR